MTGASIKPGGAEKFGIYRNWFERHAPPLMELFSPHADLFILSVPARTLLPQCRRPGLYLYVMALPSAGFHVPLYVGKSRSPSSRWNTGHVAGLNKNSMGSYAAWRRTLAGRGSETLLYLLHESEIVEPPLRGFPRTVGAVEYQLIALATDFSALLLNSEGVPG
jgi:hypothetical protein